jgi:hypothetical protein
MFTGVLDTVRSQVPTIHSQGCENWRQIFSFIPSSVILVPCTLVPLPRGKSLQTHSSGGIGLKAGLAQKISRRSKALGSRGNLTNLVHPQPSPIASPIRTITVLVFNTPKLPANFVEEATWKFLIKACQLNSPLLVNVDR